MDETALRGVDTMPGLNDLAAEARSARRVLLIGWDAADWRFIEPLIERGLMPTLAAFRARAAWGNLGSLRPALSPMLWTSIATGKRPPKHGVLGFVEPTPDGRQVRRVASSTRRCKALWNLLSERGLRSNVIGWYATCPAEPIAGTMVGDGFELPVAPAESPWPVPAGAIHPADQADELAALRVHPGELDAAALLPFVPRAAEIDLKSDPRLAELAGLLAQTISIHTMATHLMERGDWDFTAIYYEGIDRFGHKFMPFHPPAMSGVSAPDAAIYGQVMTGCYRFHDMMLQRLLELAGPDTTVLLVSDHGYFHDARRPGLEADPTEWHRPMGIACAAGPGIRAGERLFGATLLDVTPTILSLFGLPAGRDMDGRSWSEILSAPPVAAIASWETNGVPRLQNDVALIDADAEREAVRQLVALGYLEAPAAAGTITPLQAEDLCRQNLALSHLDAGQAMSALPILRELAGRHATDRALVLLLATACAMAGDLAEARRIALPLANDPSPQPRVWLLLGRIALSENSLEEAGRWFAKVEGVAPDASGLHLRLAQVHLQAGEFQAAARLLEPLVQLDDEMAAAHDGLAEARLGMGQSELALESALRAAELAHFFPRAHFHVGRALANLGQISASASALELCLHQAPHHLEARELLAEMCAKLGRSEEAASQAARAQFSRAGRNLRR